MFITAINNLREEWRIYNNRKFMLNMISPILIRSCFAKLIWVTYIFLRNLPNISPGYSIIVD